MKKIFLLLICTMFLLSGCGTKNDAKEAAKEYLNKYNEHDSVILNQIDSMIAEENFSDSQKDIYRDVLKRQYKDLSYEIVTEEYDGDDAIVTVKITVYDLYKVQKDAEEYLQINNHEFYDENDIYDRTLFLDYKLDKMNTTTLTVTYTIDLYLTNTDNKWKVSQPSNAVLEKIHGIYNYDNK